MEKYPNKTTSKPSKSFERLIDKIIHRFKMIKRNSHSSVADIQPSAEFSTSNHQYEEFFSDSQYEWQYRKIAPEDLEPFCEQLAKFLKYVRNIQELAYMTYDYPSILQTRLEKETNELHSLYMEVKDTVINIDRLKKQKKMVKKEKSCVKKALKKLRDDEVHMMENFLSLHDKTMFARWENIKNTHKPEVLEILLNDVKGKQQALEYLNTLVSRRLGQLQIFVPLLTSTENAAAAVLASTPPIAITPSSVSNGTTGTDSSTTEDQNCSTVIRRHHHGGSSSSARTESRRRRRRNQERNESHNSTRSTTVQQEQSNSDLPLLPFSLGNNPFHILGPTIAIPVNTTTTITTTTNTGSNSHHELVTVVSSTNTTSTMRSNDSSSNGGSNTNIGSEFQSEMRSVLQALFGELHQSSPTTITINGPEHDNDNTSREIELYTIRRPSATSPPNPPPTPPSM